MLTGLICTLLPNAWLLNYLAHAYLSFGSDAVLVGNLVSDFVKGRAWQDFPPPIQKGISLHRKIDTFTDAHPECRRARQYLSEAAGRYTGVFLDIIFDHFLANDSGRFSPGSLAPFAARVYDTIRMEPFPLPDMFLRMFHFMEAQDWLSNYAFREGIRRSLNGMVHRARYLSDQAPVYEAFVRYYEELGRSYQVFFPELEAYAREQFSS